MRTDSLRVVAWSAVIIASLVFVAEVRRLAVPPEAPVQETRSVTPPAPPPAEVAYVGNTNTHRFHLATCHYATCKNCTARFATRREAIDAGYRPGGCCDP